MKTRFSLAAVLVFAGLGVSSTGAATIGPILDYRDAVGPGTPGNPASLTIIINTKFWRITDRIIIDIPALATDAIHIAGVGFVSPTSNPGQSRVTTVYGVDANPASSGLSLDGLSASAPEFALGAGGNEVITAGGAFYQASSPLWSTRNGLGNNPLYSGFDFSSFGGASDSQFLVFDTIVPTADVPEPASLGLLALGGIVMMRRGKRQ